MTVHISRDYTPINTGYAITSMNFTAYLYGLAIFLNRILGYSIVGQTDFEINNTNSQSFTNSAATNIAVASGGQSLPQSTINVGSTTGFPASGTIYVASSAGVQIVKYSGTTATTFTNCTGGTGTMTAGVTTTIAIGSNGAALPQATINVASTTSFPTSGTIYVITTAGPQIVTYTGTNATQFTGCSGGTGTMTTGNNVSSAGGVVAYGVNKILTATGAPWTITTTFPHGMSNGDYGFVSGGGAILATQPFSPYPVQVVNSTQLILTNSTGGGGYTTNSQTLFPCGLLIASGTGASVNFAGAPSVNAVQLPTSTRTVVSGTAPSTGDVGRLLVLKSNLYPTKNSGVFKITAVNTATNSYTIDYRSTDTPPPETGMSWWLYEIETQASNYMLLTDYNRASYGLLGAGASNTTPIQITYNINGVSGFKTGQRVTVSGVGGNTAANGTWTITVNGANTFLLDGSSGNGAYTSGGTVTRTGYTSGLLSYNSRLILQSPHSTGWQVRIAMEQYNTPTTIPYSSASIGYGGTSSGDFTVGGVTTHIPQFLDIIPSAQYQYTIVGASNETEAPRLTIVGDDGGRSVFLYTRTQSAGNNGILTFGLPDNEPSPLPVTINRPFVYGSINANTIDWGGIQMKFGQNNNGGFAFRNVSPEICAIAGLINADGVSSGVVPNYSSNAGDCPFTNTTEVIPWEIWSGVATDTVSFALPYPSSGPTIYSVNPRFMGTAPFIRQGRTNFGSFTLSTDSTATSTVSGATNTSPIQITTSAINALTTGQTVVITGVTGNTAANGTWVISVIDNTHFTLTGSTGNGTYTGSGSVQGTARWLHLQNGIYLQWNGAGGLTA